MSEILIQRGLPDSILPKETKATRALVLAQPGSTHVATAVGNLLESDGLATELVGLPDRDEAKSIEVVKSVYEVLARFGLARDDVVVGVGGGAVTDVAGFIAGTWMRGVDVVQVPTTLVGAVDAAIGGKTGINFAGKNLVGVFWTPRRVIVDLSTLEALPGYLLREGFAEALKTGLVGDAELAALIGKEGIRADLQDVVKRAVAVKTGLVEDDPLDRGERAFLNFGHTIGHGLEYASTLSHGESVALGMVAAGEISRLRTGFGGLADLEAALASCGLPTRIDGIDAKRVLDLVGMDKKRVGAETRMVLLRDVARPLLQNVGERELALGLQAIGL